MKVDLKDWERVVWREKGSVDRFLDYFTKHEKREKYLNSVLWNTAGIYVRYVTVFKGEQSRHEFYMSMDAWNEYYEKNRDWSDK